MGYLVMIIAMGWAYGSFHIAGQLIDWLVPFMSNSWELAIVVWLAIAMPGFCCMLFCLGWLSELRANRNH